MKPLAVLLGAVVMTISAPASRDQGFQPSAAVEVELPIVREPTERFDVPIRHARQGSLNVYLPDNCILDADFDLVIHFHGAPPVFERALRESGLNAVIAVENRGVMSKAYENRYSWTATFQLLMQRIVALVDRVCPGNAHRPRRVALSAWSAGYAAVQDILADPDRAAHVDAVLLADGIHAAFVHPKLRDFADNALAPFVRFAQEAVAERKLMLITHSEVPTDNYASTTESTDYLLGRLNLHRDIARRPGPIDGMREVTEAGAGNFSVRGYERGDETAHSQHLWAYRDTLLEPLMDYWESRPPPVTNSAERSREPISVTVEVSDDETCTVVGTYVECRETE